MRRDNQRVAFRRTEMSAVGPVAAAKPAEHFLAFGLDVLAEFKDIAVHVVQAEAIRRIRSDWLRSLQLGHGKVRLLRAERGRCLCEIEIHAGFFGRAIWATAARELHSVERGKR